MSVNFQVTRELVVLTPQAKIYSCQGTNLNNIRPLVVKPLKRLFFGKNLLVNKEIYAMNPRIP